ncbi:hypothetical protein ACFPJ4_09800 [Lysinimonas soli]|uniref:Ferritin-like domain-containing protein n=1 Tax=Lysinimonas soli TaxID=1074233 RepID=A0ABW0NPN6_9MICO
MYASDGMNTSRGPASESIDPGAGWFDVREFARTAHGSHRAELDLETIAGTPLGADSVRLIRTLRDLERSTMNRMRNLLVTATHKDARVTAFLTTWAFEKFWIADALDAVLDASGAPLASTEFEGPTRSSFAERAERRGPVRRAIVANFAGPQIVAAHVTTQLVDEWIAQAAYRKLAEMTAALGTIVEMIVDIKDRHIHFFTEEAQRRLASSSRARKLAARAIRQAVWPIGAVELPDKERSFFESIVFGSPEGAVEASRISSRLAALPGMARVAPTVAARLVP